MTIAAQPCMQFIGDYKYRNLQISDKRMKFVSKKLSYFFCQENSWLYDSFATQSSWFNEMYYLHDKCTPLAIFHEAIYNTFYSIKYPIPIILFALGLYIWLLLETIEIIVFIVLLFLVEYY
jgi:hypothetical protein